MTRQRLLLVPMVAILILVGLSSGLTAIAQTDSLSTPSASGTPDSEQASDKIWFVLAPKGKVNGDYFDVQVDAGQSVTLTATIGNGSAIPVKALMYAADVNSGVNGGFILNNADVPVSVPTTWIDFPTSIYEFQPGEGFEKQFTITVPAGTAPGQYITGLAIETADAAPMKGDAPMLVKYRLITAVLITVPGPVTPGFTIGEIEASTDNQTTTISAAIANTGNIRVQPQGTVTFTDSSGTQVVNAPISMGSVYAGDTTPFEVYLPTPLPEGTYTASVDLKDPDTGAGASISNQEVTVAKPVAPAPISITNFVVAPMPSAENVVFAQISATIANTGSGVTGGEVSLQVFRDGEQVDDHVFATSMTIQNGDTAIDQTYIPQSGKWEAGSYTFQLTLSSIDPATGTKSVVATVESDQTMVIE